MIIKKTIKKKEIIIPGITYMPIIKNLNALILVTLIIPIVALVPLFIFFITREKDVLSFAIQYLILLIALIKFLSTLLQLLLKKIPM